MDEEVVDVEVESVVVSSVLEVADECVEWCRCVGAGAGTPPPSVDWAVSGADSVAVAVEVGELVVLDDEVGADEDAVLTVGAGFDPDPWWPKSLNPPQMSTATRAMAAAPTAMAMRWLPRDEEARVALAVADGSRGPDARTEVGSSAPAGAAALDRGVRSAAGV